MRQRLKQAAGNGGWEERVSCMSGEDMAEGVMNQLCRTSVCCYLNGS